VQVNIAKCERSQYIHTYLGFGFACSVIDVNTNAVRSVSLKHHCMFALCTLFTEAGISSYVYWKKQLSSKVQTTLAGDIC